MRLTTMDLLTDMLDERLLPDVLARETVRAARLGRPVSFLLLEPIVSGEDHSQALSDLVLGQVAKLIKRHLRNADTAFRLGHQIFVILPGRDDLGAQAAAETLIGQVEVNRFAGLDDLTSVAATLAAAWAAHSEGQGDPAGLLAMLRHRLTGEAPAAGAPLAPGAPKLTLVPSVDQPQLPLEESSGTL